MMWEILLISSFVSFYVESSALITQKEKEGGNWKKKKTEKLNFEVFENHPLVFHIYDISNGDILRIIWRHPSVRILYFCPWEVTLSLMTTVIIDILI